MMVAKPLAIPLLSGGIDSAVATLYAKESLRYERIEPIFIDWRAEFRGKRSQTAKEREVEAARRIARTLGIRAPKIIKAPFHWYAEKKAQSDDVWPYARNLVFLAIAASYAVTNYPGNNNMIVIGLQKSDRGVADTSPEFLRSARTVIRMAIDENKKGSRVDVIAPLIEMTKGQAVRYAYEHNGRQVIDHSWSCYLDGAIHCGKCRGCYLRKEAFKSVGIVDETKYGH